MSEMIERVAEAIMKVEAEDKISDYYKFARAAIEAIKDDLQERALDCTFYEDKHALFCAAEELEEALGKVSI